MPRCPSCAKRFKTEDGTLRHLNHPHSTCAGWLNSFIPQHHSSDIRPPRNQTGMFSTVPEWHPTVTMDANMDMDAEEDVQIPQDGSGLIVDEFPGAGASHGPGKSFIDAFRSDRFANERVNNLYYPFASKSEWEIGSFLLRSNLSMSAIDEFLCLDRVSSSSHLHHLI